MINIIYENSFLKFKYLNQYYKGFQIIEKKNNKN